MPGDGLKRIHWRTSAHRDALMVRQVEAAVSEDWWIFADLDASVQAGNGVDSTLELVIVLAASLVTRGLKEHHQVGLALEGPKLAWMEPRSGPAQHWNLIRALAAAGPGSYSLTDLLSVRQAPHSGSLIVITPSRNPEWVALAMKSWRGGKLKILLVNPAEFGLSVNQDRFISLLSKWDLPFANV